jgi:hypothetical protein
LAPWRLNKGKALIPSWLASFPKNSRLEEYVLFHLDIWSLLSSGVMSQTWIFNDLTELNGS